MAQVRAFMREGVLEKLFAGEELEIGVMDPALTHALIGQPVNVLEQQQPDHEPGLDPRSAVLAVERCDLGRRSSPNRPCRRARTNSCFRLMI